MPKNIVFYADDDTDDFEVVKEVFDTYNNNVEVVTAKRWSAGIILSTIVKRTHSGPLSLLFTPLRIL